MLPLRSGSTGLLVSSVGDPYNQYEFWSEVYRILKPGGISLFTTPSYEWAVAFRVTASNEIKMKAEFELEDGRRVYVPSWIYSKDEQIKMIEKNGLLVKDVADVPTSALKSNRLSPKLLVGHGSQAIVVTGYMLMKA
jgi:hypothetical protein